MVGIKGLGSIVQTAILAVSLVAYNPAPARAEAYNLDLPGMETHTIDLPQKHPCKKKYKRLEPWEQAYATLRMEIPTINVDLDSDGRPEEIYVFSENLPVKCSEFKWRERRNYVKVDWGTQNTTMHNRRADCMTTTVRVRPQTDTLVLEGINSKMEGCSYTLDLKNPKR